MKCKKDIKLISLSKRHLQGIKNGGKITMEHETKLIDVSEQYSIDKVLFDDSTDICR